ncbi:dephospho-CoA kinase [Spirulina sp. 06S082]|uniref:dephospho-CoA kinase n=1 Tax=Spirulina sp. 06S082 TaxID=3110248 RepID=UPI002B1F8B24|nr:dephospho-CoA kinase [Spirulina sp. 06S082]MEA5470541.1 dephospho-CoA kinase [Spirulina sp. 06S082]
MIYRIGLTGGISTGKSTVSQYLDRVHGLPILDADIYAREAVDRNSPILTTIAQRYGEGILLPDRCLQRQKLGEIVFSDPEERKWLEAQIHPYVRDRFVTELATLNATIAVLVIPLLFEADMTNFVNSIWVVSCSPEQQLQRLCDRDGISPEQARSRIDSQIPLTEKIAAANVVLDNSSTVEHLLSQVDAALNHQ